ncbi:unnamed protein product [Gordionus sp. m RMFG-2023]|uniref:RNA pseudouridylate synthase domain-containing protein 1-like n=1 Tax=Gordionus sp. m RMFG-2023 TaxID=3053472 RepID=UPI0030E425F9
MIWYAFLEYFRGQFFSNFPIKLKWKIIQFLKIKHKRTNNCTEDNLILHENTDYIIVNKPCNIALTNYDDNSKSLAKDLAKMRPDLMDTDLRFKIRFPHRIDYGTSGLLCAAINNKTSVKLSELFRNRLVSKFYLALVYGHLDTSKLKSVNSMVNQDLIIKPHCKMLSKNFKIQDIDQLNDCQRLNNLIINHITTVGCIHKNQLKSKFKTKFRSNNPKFALTLINPLQWGYYNNFPCTKVICSPMTGRRHQIRLHCKDLGHSIVGDYTYYHYNNHDNLETSNNFYKFRKYMLVDTLMHRINNLKIDRTMLHSFYLSMPNIHYVDRLSITTNHSAICSQKISEFIGKDPFISANDPLWIVPQIKQNIEMPNIKDIIINMQKIAENIILI